MSKLQCILLPILILCNGAHSKVDTGSFTAINFPDEDWNHIVPRDTDEQPILGEEIPATPNQSSINPKIKPKVELLPSDHDPAMDSISTIEDFLESLDLDEFLPVGDNETFVVPRFGGAAAGFQGDIALRVSQAICQPELKVVHLELPDKEEDTQYFPTCVKVPRCGGCCFSPQHACQPTITEQIKVEVVKVGAIGEIKNQPPRRGRGQRRRKRRTVEIEEFSVEEHLKCECGCIIKSDSCNGFVHVYNPKTCSCDCKNKKEEDLCENLSTHYWDKKTCRCLCRNFARTKCSSKRSFSHATCSCLGG